MPHHAIALNQDDIRFALGQKIMLDFRYFCEKGNGSTCRTPVTTLPAPLAQVIAKHHIGGVILFSENTQTISQTFQLTSELLAANQRNKKSVPLFIAIDQEGGRVARLNREEATSFTGNMSIGATYPRKGTYYATEVASVIAKELNHLAINVNFAPTVDVNMNPSNPVINVRSFGEDPEIVAKLGAAQVTAMENSGVISALKHFPGHGDTHVDSHTGLPLVSHDKQTIFATDLKPFAEIIKTAPPGMIMTAHIQYPNLDDSTVTSSGGKAMVRPATMSKKIMTELLRDELGYKGVTITDALDMAGISAFFDPLQAVIETFNAGVDIALMPVPIRSIADIHRFNAFMDNLTEEVVKGRISKTLLDASLQRVLTLKKSLKSINLHSLAQAKSVIGNPSHRALEKALALDSITLVKNDNVLPLTRTHKLHIITPDSRKGEALKQAMLKINSYLSITYSSLQALDETVVKHHIEQANILIAAHASPQQSAVEIGGAEDVELLKSHRLQAAQQPKTLMKLMGYAQDMGKKTVFISLRAPYEIADFSKLSDAVLASYAYNIDVDSEFEVSGPAFTALSEVILGKHQASGVLPVTIK
ncbi:glycoside hydrolase family 3 protein (plasmid) [Pseudoalteromonas xiamenensis]|uniref:glycoside hydrolase family 3 protein n=1 Tax=Pseudoalteromonas xiamenensis TaxID=882626 RepID=UPI0027E4319E|nr:glycoside hydrolase family 3 N-terminal domain-containing protein [Pseudoalteromonas xiamenensis]WMN61868.1 glycoside hydrolase family 3 protein [Pseudoalteromonas xiamenensis]